MTEAGRRDPGSVVTDDNASVYLTQSEPSPRATILIKQVGQHAGREVPWWMFAELAVRLDDARAWITERSGLERKVRRYALAAILALAGNLVLLAGGVATHLKAQGAAEEREAQRDRSFLEYRDSVRRDMDRMEQDIRDLRRDLRRLSGADKLGPDGSEETPPLDADKFSLLDGSSLLLAAGALSSTSTPAPIIRPRTCGDICSSSIECTSHFGRVCPFCSFGNCSATRPEEPPPTPTDAGIDAAPGGTTP